MGFSFSWNKKWAKVRSKLKHNHWLRTRVCLLAQVATCWEVRETEEVVAVCVWMAFPLYPPSDLHARDTVKVCETVVVRDAFVLKSKAVRNTVKVSIHPSWFLRHLACVTGFPQWCGLCMVCVFHSNFHSELTDTGGLTYTGVSSPAPPPLLTEMS